MRATLKTTPSYSLVINGHEIGGFLCVSEWEGFKKLQDGKGRTAIVLTNSAEGFAAIFDGIFHSAEALSCVVVKASPDLVSELEKATP